MVGNPLYDLRSESDKAAASYARTQTYQERYIVKCDYPYLECDKLFKTEKEMKQHKHKEPDHFYCSKCEKLDNKKRDDGIKAGITYPPKKPAQFDFEDWDAFSVHKVDAMAPFVEGRQKPTDDNPPPHITCEFCGEDFKSFGGRKRHRADMHPADQGVECPGCKQRFVRAHTMIRHIEHNQCPNIRPLEFYREISQKKIVRQFMHAPRKLMDNLEANKAPMQKYLGQIGPSHDDEDADPYDQDEGGVSLLDQADEAQMGGYKPLVPATDLIDLHHRGTLIPSANAECWPRLPGQGSLELQASMRSISISSKAQKHQQDTQAAEPRVRRDSAIKSCDNEFAKSKPTTTSAWTSKTSEKLFPYSKEPKSDIKAGDWSGVLAQKEARAVVDNTTSPWKSRWWDPTSADYNVEIFYNNMAGGYLCPFESCENDNLRFDSPSELHVHMAHAHIRQVFGCPSCHKRFYSPSSLVAHAESTRKCYVRDSAKFRGFIDEITGGFLKVKDVPVPKIYHTDAVIKKGPQVQGVKEFSWSGQNPATS
ncbi:hypothetical protein DOTSEDRAFT_69724 [Dothistroma septosporum NZE10]|uniref:C2H2-type domain-containing protein n=1 Tax=Dothistroma septosporum (strain NZE10 / CBS 128990) TaxID=675120 RepID=N1Q079_DOTSN|nr:hypothetical protein DOTSEDRAFT_69724 [Dothistroma septosporum NZE10]